MLGRLIAARRARSLRRGEDGSVVIIASGLFTLLGCCAVIAADLGMVYLERREAQRAVDLAALSAVNRLDEADAIVNLVLADNGVPKYSTLQIVTGRYVPDASLAPAGRFTPGATPPNAIRVALTKDAPLFFGRTLLARDSVEIGVEAIATATDMAAFSIGSRLLSLEGGVANALLSQFLGTTISLRAVDYRALAAADVDLFRMFDALAASGSVEAVTYQDVLNGSVPYSDFAAAVAAAFGAGSPEAAEALDSFAEGASSVSAEISLADIIDPGPYGAAPPGGAPDGVATAPLLATLVAAAALANGENQVVADIGAALPGLVTARLRLAIGERAQESGWIAIGPEGTTVRTAQVRLGLELTAGGEGLLSSVHIHLPLIVEVAQAEATLADIVCEGITPKQVTIDARPGIANAWIGEISPFDLTTLAASMITPARIIDTAFLDVEGRAHVEAADMEAERLTFSAADVEEDRVRTVATTDITQSLVTALLDDLTLKVDTAFGLSLDIGTPGAVREQLAAIAAQADAVLADVFDLLGIGLGEADIMVHRIQCGGPGLVG